MTIETDMDKMTILWETDSFDILYATELIADKFFILISVQCTEVLSLTSYEMYQYFLCLIFVVFFQISFHEK